MQKGFSLIELILVLFIAAILLMIMVPSQKIFLDHAAERSRGSQLFQAIHLSRNAAISHNKPILLCKSSDHKMCSGGWQDGYIILENKKVMSVFQNNPADGVLYWRSSLRRDYLEFMPEGTTHGENGTFWYCPNEAVNPVWAIIVSQSGRAREVFPDQFGKIKDAEGKWLSCSFSSNGKYSV